MSETNYASRLNLYRTFSGFYSRRLIVYQSHVKKLRNIRSSKTHNFILAYGSSTTVICSLQKDRVESGRSSSVGKIEVSRHDVTFAHKAMGVHRQPTADDFVQANKKDVTDITKLSYTMTTTRQGKRIRNGKPCDPSSAKDTKPEKKMLSYYNIGNEVGKLQLEYHMTHTLIDWGIKLVRPDWSN